MTEGTSLGSPGHADRGARDSHRDDKTAAGAESYHCSTPRGKGKRPVGETSEFPRTPKKQAPHGRVDEGVDETSGLGSIKNAWYLCRTTNADGNIRCGGAQGAQGRGSPAVATKADWNRCTEKAIPGTIHPVFLGKVLINYDKSTKMWVQSREERKVFFCLSAKCFLKRYQFSLKMPAKPTFWPVESGTGMTVQERVHCEAVGCRPAFDGVVSHVGEEVSMEMARENSLAVNMAIPGDRRDGAAPKRRTTINKDVERSITNAKTGVMALAENGSLSIMGCKLEEAMYTLHATIVEDARTKGDDGLDVQQQEAYAVTLKRSPECECPQYLKNQAAHHYWPCKHILYFCMYHCGFEPQSYRERMSIFQSVMTQAEIELLINGWHDQR